MYICICKKVTDHQIRRAIEGDEVASFAQLRECYGVGSQCGKCARYAKQIVHQTLRDTVLADDEPCLAAA